MFKFFVFQSFRVVFTVANILFLPIFGILFIPIYIHRFIAAQLAKLLRPHLGRIMTTRSTNFANDRLYTNPACFTITSQTFKGHFPLSTYRNSFTNRVIESKFPDETLRYPELKQYPYQWMRFYFWKPETNFDIKEHIYQLPYKDGQYLTTQDIRKIQQELHSKPFQKDRSPWEILMAYSDHPSLGKQTLILFKIHHGMADGYSILKLLVERLAENDKAKNAKPKYFRRSHLANVIYWSTFPFRAICEFCSTGLTVMMEKSPWFAPRNNRGPSFVAISKPISIDRVKALKNKFGVTFTSVVYGVCSLTMKSWMTKEKIPIPNWISCVLPFPMPGHPAKLRNFMSQVTPSLPLGLCSSAEDTLTRTDKIYNDIKKSTAPCWNFIMGKATGGLYSSLCNVIVSSLIPSVLMTNFPAKFDEPIVIDGYECANVYFFCGLLNLPGLGFYILSYVDTLTVSIVADSTLMSEFQVKELADLIESEIQKLELLPVSSIQTKSKKVLSLV